MLKTDYRPSMKHLILLAYFLILISLLLLLAREIKLEQPPFSLSNSAEVQIPSGSSLVSIPGNAFQSGIKGLSARTLVNEEALLWRQLVDIPSYNLAVKDDLLLVSCSSYGKVVSIGLDDNGKPSLRGSLQLPAGVTQLDIVGSRAIVGLHRHNGYALIDLENPSELKLLSHKKKTGLISDMSVAGDMVYFADLYSGVGRIDMSQNDAPHESLFALDSPWRIDHFDDKLAVGTLKGEVRLYDIDMDGALQEVKTLFFPTNVRGVAFTEGSLSVAIADGTLSVYDLSKWPDLTPAGQLSLPGSPLMLGRIPGAERVLVNMVAGGLAAVDVSSPVAPSFSGHHRVAQTFWGVAASSDKVFGVSRKGLEAFSVDLIENGADAMLAIEALLAKEAYKLKEWHGQVVAYDGNSISSLAGSPLSNTSDSRYLPFIEKDHINIFEQQQDHSFQRVGASLEVAGVTASEFYQDRLYVLHRKGLSVLAVDKVDDMRPLGELALPGLPRKFAFTPSGIMIVATRNAGTHIVDIGRPERPVLLATVAPLKHMVPVNVAHDVFVKGDLAFVSYGTGGVHVIDVSRPEQPELVQIVRTPGLAKDMGFYDGLLLVADGLEGLYIIDTDFEGSVLPVGSLQMPLRIDDMAIAGEELIVSNHPGGTMSLPLPERLASVNVVREDEVRVALDKVAAGQYVYLYDERNSGKVKVARP